jgi:ubiquinone/menaquinone biosynthesis C-methylase UbiE
MILSIWRHLLRLAFHLLYNPLAFAYDGVSWLVSCGRWRAWTKAALPYLVGERVLEIPCGTGNLMLDLSAAGFSPAGVDVSPAMLQIAQKKLLQPERSRQAAQSKGAPLLRANARALPFAAAVFDSVSMTFPPSFVYDPNALSELQRVLRDEGRLVWVDGGRLKSRNRFDAWLNRAFNFVDGGDEMARRANTLLARTDFDSRIETVEDAVSVVTVLIATKKPSP